MRAFFARDVERELQLVLHTAEITDRNGAQHKSAFIALEIGDA